MPDEVGADIGRGVLDAVAHAGLRPEVDDAVESVGVGQALQRVGVGEIDPLEAEPLAEIARQPVDAGLLERGVVIVVEVVDPDDLLAAFEQGAAGRRTDETRGSGDEDGHGRAIGAGAVRSSRPLWHRPRPGLDAVARQGRKGRRNRAEPF